YARIPLGKGPNFPRAGARPATSMTPTLVGRGGRPTLAIGASGGARMPTAVLQVLHHLLATDAALPDAIAAPRWFPPASGGLALETELAHLEGDLRARGEVVDVGRPSFAAVSAVRALPGGVVEAASDARRQGAAAIV